MNVTGPIPRLVREVVTFLLGASGFAHELLIAHGERPFIISASLALMGLPFVIRGEEKLKSAESGSEEEEK